MAYPTHGLPTPDYRTVAARYPSPPVRDRSVPLRKITPADVMVGALEVYDVDFSDYAGIGRHPNVVECRMVSWVAMRRMTYASFPEIARLCRRPNHSTIITACERFRMAVSDGERADLIDRLSEVMRKTVEKVDEECRQLRDARRAEELQREKEAREGAA